MLASLTILIVDDDDAFRDSLTRLLERLGYRARAVATARDAAMLLTKEPIDVALIDIQMPEIGGHRLMRELGRQGVQVPFIAMSGSADRDDVILALRAEALDFLVKPIEMGALEQALEKVARTSEGEAGVSQRPSSLQTRGSHPVGRPGASAPGALPAPSVPSAGPAAVSLAPPSSRADSPEVASSGVNTGNRPAAGGSPLLDRADQVIGDLIAGKIELPTFHEAVKLVLRLARLPRLGVDRVAETVNRDRSLAAAILGAANRSDQDSGRPVVTVRDACVRLGNLEVAAIAKGHAIRRALSLDLPDGWGRVANDLLRNAVVTANGARQIARLADRTSPVPEAAQLAAFLHNIGEPATLSALAANGLLADPTPENRADVLAIISRHHERVGAALLQRWKLPARLVSLTGQHHVLPPPGGPLTDYEALDVTVMLAWTLTVNLGIHAGDVAPPAPDPELLAVRLGVELDRVERDYRRAPVWARVGLR